MNSRDPFFPGRAGPWTGYTPGTHSIYSSPPRFPYNTSSPRSHQGYVPGGVVYGPSPFLDRDHSPTPPSYGRSGLDHYSAARWTHATSPISRRRATPLQDEGDPDPVVFNAGVTFRMGGETQVHRHVEVQPAHTTPEAPSAALTRQIDKFLRKSDHALDRYSGLMESRSSSVVSGRRGRSVTPGGGLALDSSDTSLALRAQRSTSAASIAVKAEKHLESLGSVGRRQTGPIAEGKEEDEDFDTTSSSDSFDDLSDDTSDDLSKLSALEGDATYDFQALRLDDLSSDSDDEYFDVVTLPGLRPPLPAASSAASSRPNPVNKILSAPLNPPAHSRSLPAVNKGPPKRAMGNNPVHTAAPSQGADTPSAPPKPEGARPTSAAPQAAAAPTPKTAAPHPPPVSAAPPSVAPWKTADRLAPQPPATPAAVRASTAAGKGETLKKYPAPQPPKDTKEPKDVSDPQDAINTKDSQNTRDAKNNKQENKRDKQDGETDKQADKQHKPDRPEANKASKLQCDSLEKSPQNKVNSAEAPPRANTTITPASSGVTISGDAEKALGATPKPRRAPSFKKYPAPQPPATPARPKSDGVTFNIAREDITTASSGSVPSLLQTPVSGLNTSPSGPSWVERPSPDTQSTHSSGKAEQEAPGGKQLPRSPSGGSLSRDPSARKVRAGSPVPDKVSVAGKKASAAPVVTGKLKIATGDGAATVKQESALKDKVSLKVAEKEDGEGSGDTSIPVSKSAKVETKEAVVMDDSKNIPNGDLARGSSPEKSLGKKTRAKLTKNTDTASPGSAQQQDSTAKGKAPKATKTKKPQDEIIENHVTNGTHEAEEGKAADDDQSKYKKMNGTHPEEDQANGRGETRSRSSSVASDVTSPDVSQKSSSSKRNRGGKLAGIMNKFEVEESPKGGEKVKPKAKVGKISGLASVFEAGKDAGPAKTDTPSLKSPEKKAPEAKPVSIAGITTSKFGGVAKFRKPPDPKKKEESKPLSAEETTKSSNESSKKKEEVNGIADKTENEKEAKKASEHKADKESAKKKDEVNGVINNTENSLKKKEKSNIELPVKKKDQINGVIENCENEQESKKPPDKKSKESSVKKKDYMNGTTESVENGVETKTQLISKKTEKGSETPPGKKKSYINGVTESAETSKEIKKPHKPEHETEMQVKTNEKVKTDAKKNGVSEVPETLTNGDLLSDESSLSSSSEIEKDLATAALSDPVIPAAAGRGGATQGTTSEGPAKPRPAKQGDTESKITLGRSGSAKGTKDSGEKETVSKGVKAKTDVTEAPTVKALATSTQAAKLHAAKVDKSHSKSTEVEAPEQTLTPARGTTCQPQPLDVTKGKKNDGPEKNEPSVASKGAGTSAVLDGLSKNEKEATADTTVTLRAPKASRDTAADKAVTDVKVSDAKTARSKEAAAAATTAEASSKALKSTSRSSPVQHASTSLLAEHKPEGEKIEIKVIPKATLADQPLTKITVIAKATVSDEHLALTTPTDEASQDTNACLALPSPAGAEGCRVPNSSSAPQLSTLGGASSFSWKTNRIRRKLDYAIENTATMLPRMESEVEELLREASDYLGPERRARRSWTPTFVGTKSTTGSCPQLASRRASRAKSSGEDEEEVYEDALDPSQLDTLMPLPDVQVERERRSRSRTPLEGPERSLSNNSMVAQAEALLSETDRLLRRSRSDKSLRRSYSRSLSSAALNKLAEVTADLSEEHNTAHLAGERLEAEQAERMKLEKEVERLQNNMRMMSTANGKLEMEKQALQSEVLNGEADHDEEEAADASLYRRKYEWCLREIELLKKQLKQQQEDDLDHLLLLKKQLEKKVADAYEETEEQRQVVAQVKRKSQRLQAEMNDLKILLEEQTSRNNLLEKKQRKFDQDMMAAQEELRHERGNKDKVQREKDQILSEKYSFEQEVATLKLELELKEEKLSALNRQLEDLNFTGKSEEEVAVLKKAKHDLELRVKDQEEELDDLAGQVQMLEGAKVRLEMSIEQMRKENRREVSQREEELEEVRISAQKKVKALESQLENEHEERTLLVREKHELERRVSDLQDRNVGHVDEEYVHKLKKELKKTKALLRDTQTMLEKSQSEGGQKLLVRQLKTQLEDAEFAKTAAIKARQCADADVADLTSQMEEAQRARKEAEDRCARIAKERAEIQTQLEESEEEVAEVMKKYKSVVSQLSVDQITLSEQTQQIAELEHEKQVLHERLLELSSKVEVLEGETANIHTQRRLELKIKEVESKLELEQTTRQRLESQIGRLKDQLERVTGDCDSARLKEAQAVEQNKRVARQLRDAKEDLATLQQRHTDAVNKKSEMEKQLELADSEVSTLKSDLKLAFKRIEDLQQAIQGDLNDSDSDLSDSDSDSDGSLSSYLTASLKQQMSSSNSTLRTPPSEVHQLDRAEQPTSPCSEAISEDLEEAAATRESFA